MEKEVSKQNAYLQEHAGAKPQVALRKVLERSEKLKLSSWVTTSLQEREIRLTIDEAALEEARKLDGCYVLKTDVKKNEASKETIHDRFPLTVDIALFIIYYSWRERVVSVTYGAFPQVREKRPKHRTPRFRGQSLSLP